MKLWLWRRRTVKAKWQGKLFHSVEDAIADLHYVYAATARTRDIDKHVLMLILYSRDYKQNSKNAIKHAEYYLLPIVN